MLQHQDYKVGWICALTKEQTAAIAMLDKRHRRLSKPPTDSNTYTLGSIGEHNIVIACLPKGMYGTIPAATVASNMTSTFPAIRFGLMVGIGGGIPPQVRLGDVVVSVPHGTHPGVVQWDMGKTEQAATFKRTGALNNPPTSLLTALASLESDQELGITKIPQYLEELGMNFPSLKGKYLKSDLLKDVLFDQGYSHEGEATNCGDCAKDRIIERGPEKFTAHYGTIASGNQVIKDANFRKSLVEDLGGKVLCIEMEAVGLMNNFPCIVIRGICDYADSHKNKAWQEHAAAVAAAFAKELLGYVSADEVVAEVAAKDVLSQISQTMTNIRAATVETQQLLKKKEDTDVLDWISSNHYGPEQSEALKQWHPDTCRWFLDSEKYRFWLEKEGRALFCPGIPGAGKTTMSAAVIHDINRRFSVNANANVGLAYVYFAFSRQREQTVEHVLSSLLMQFLRRKSSLPDFARDLFKHHSMGATQPTHMELYDALGRIVSQYRRAYIVLDALDECMPDNQGRRKVMSDIFGLQLSCGVNIIATSRMHEEIASMFYNRDTTTSILPIRADEGDVSVYLQHQLEAQGKDVFDDPIRELVALKLTQVSEGMFLFARLHINRLIEMPTKRKVKIALEGLATGPDGLHDVYEQTMDRIQSQGQGRRDLAGLILQWIVHARRPLSAKELQHALGVEPSSTGVDEDNIPSLRTLKSVCGGLVQVDEESNMVGLIHYTAQEYFEKTQGKWFPDAQRYITQICVAYLSFPALGGFCDGSQKFRERLEEHPFYDYAAHEWGHHARATSEEPKVVDFLKRRDVFEGSIQALMAGETWISPHRSQHVPNGLNGLHLAAFFGLHHVIQELLDVYDINEIDSHHRTPLTVAATEGHSEVVALLIKAGNANVNFRDKHKETALSAAFKKGHLNVAELLIKSREIDVNMVFRTGETALLAAAKAGDLNVVQLLINSRDIDVNKADRRKRTPLWWAVEEGHTDVIKLLIETGGVDIDCPSKGGQSPLILAAEKGSVDVVRLLIGTGRANVNRRDKAGRTALIYAARQGNGFIVRHLQESGADTGILDFGEYSASDYAWKSGFKFMAYLLKPSGVSRRG